MRSTEGVAIHVVTSVMIVPIVSRTACSAMSDQHFRAVFQQLSVIASFEEGGRSCFYVLHSVCRIHLHILKASCDIEAEVVDADLGSYVARRVMCVFGVSQSTHTPSKQAYDLQNSAPCLKDGLLVSSACPYGDQYLDAACWFLTRVVHVRTLSIFVAVFRAS